MALFVIADLHLSSDGTKSMEKFGPRWTDYMQRLKKNWTAVVRPDDTVIIPGDISWSLKLEESLEDFRFLNSLPGKKLIGKGNHDFWWSTASKMKAFFAENELNTIDILYNNAYDMGDCIVCGTRGWYVDEKLQNGSTKDAEYNKIVSREAQRLKISLEEAKKLQTNGEQILVFFHFPPVFNSFVCDEIVDILKEYGIKHCYFGHIHGVYNIPRNTVYDGITFSLISSDYCNFVPMIVMPDDY